LFQAEDMGVLGGVELADAGGQGGAADRGLGVGGGAKETEDVLGAGQRCQADMTVRWITAW
jgi:hypothetical protein